ncbi:MAG: hypothetical protein E6J63_15475 [Deltaproteobacteria bacterium]|nr:MAG: hypothetical protein E6J63_15475 [Deltaproteobacteria bacterium]
MRVRGDTLCAVFFELSCGARPRQEGRAPLGRHAHDGCSIRLTRLLAAVGGGDAAAVNQLTPAVYEELRRFAKRHMAGRHRSHTMQTRDLRDLGHHTQLSMPTQSPRPGAGLAR